MNNKIRSIVIGLLAIAITFAIAFIAIGDSDIALRFWITLVPIVISECIIIISVTGLFGGTQTKSSPIRLATNILPWFYFLFTLVMVFAYSSGVGNSILMAIHAVGLLLFLIPTSFFSMAATSIEKNASIASTNKITKSKLKLTVLSIKDAATLAFPNDAEVSALISKCDESLQYSAESIPGSEQIDAELQAKLDAATSAITNKNADDLALNLRQFLSAIQTREATIKTLR